MTDMEMVDYLFDEYEKKKAESEGAFLVFAKRIEDICIENLWRRGICKGQKLSFVGKGEVKNFRFESVKARSNGACYVFGRLLSKKTNKPIGRTLEICRIYPRNENSHIVSFKFGQEIKS